MEGVDRPMRAASPALSLAWKLLWLATDMHPQGKDLYDAALLAEYTTVELLRPELKAEADDFIAGSALGWDVDWDNFTDEYPGITGDADTWKRRLPLGLDRGFRRRDQAPYGTRRSHLTYANAELSARDPAPEQRAPPLR